MMRNFGAENSASLQGHFQNLPTTITPTVWLFYERKPDSQTLYVGTGAVLPGREYDCAADVSVNAVDFRDRLSSLYFIFRTLCMSVFSLFSVLVFLIFFRGSGGGRRTEKFGDGKTEISCEFTRFNISKQDHAKSAFVARGKNGNPLLSGCAILRCIQYRDLLCHNTV